MAGSALSPSNIAFNLRSVLLGHHNVDIKLGEAVTADLKTGTVQTAEGQTYQGDILVLAAGSQANFFGTPGADQHTYPLYSLRNAEKLRSRILAMLELADRDPSLAEKGALHFVIVGGGATGTEMAGAFGDALQHSRRGGSSMLTSPRRKLCWLTPATLAQWLLASGSRLCRQESAATGRTASP